MRLWHLLLIDCLFLFLSPCLCLNFYLKAGDKKCIQDESNKNVIVRGSYSATPGDVSIHIRDLKSHTLFRKDRADTGKFAFTTENFEIYEICFKSELGNIIFYYVFLKRILTKNTQFMWT